MDELWEKAVETALEGEDDAASAKSLTLDGAVKCVHGRLPPPGLLEKFGQLKQLSIANVGVSSLADFPRLRNLEKLILSDNRIAGGLEHLVKAGLESLRDLDLSNNKIQFIEDLRPLAELKLVSLDLYECPVTRVEGYRARVFGMIGSLKYLDKTDVEENERPESDEDEEDEEEEDDEEEESDEEEEDAKNSESVKENGELGHSASRSERDEEEEEDEDEDDIEEEDAEEDEEGEENLSDKEDEDVAVNRQSAAAAAAASSVGQNGVAVGNIQGNGVEVNVASGLQNGGIEEDEDDDDDGEDISWESSSSDEDIEYDEDQGTMGRAANGRVAEGDCLNVSQSDDDDDDGDCSDDEDQSQAFQVRQLGGALASTSNGDVVFVDSTSDEEDVDDGDESIDEEEEDVDDEEDIEEEDEDGTVQAGSGGVQIQIYDNGNVAEEGDQGSDEDLDDVDDEDDDYENASTYHVQRVGPSHQAESSHGEEHAEDEEDNSMVNDSESDTESDVNGDEEARASKRKRSPKYEEDDSSDSDEERPPKRR